MGIDLPTEDRPLPTGDGDPASRVRRPVAALTDLRGELHARGLRWTPQRRLILEVLGETRGHVTGSEILDRCRRRDAETTPSTVYRTLDVLEELGYVHHSHGADGREEYHVLPESEHAHLLCDRCGTSWEVPPGELHGLADELAAARGFVVDVAHLTIAGRCAGCIQLTTDEGPAVTD